MENIAVLPGPLVTAALSCLQDTVLNLRQLHRDYSAQSELCLICLHVEIRVHCFVHLTVMCKKCSYDIRSSDSLERDKQVRHRMG